MWLFKFLRWTRTLLTYLFGNKYEDELFRLFQVPGLTSEEFYERLIPYCHQYNYMGACYRRQIFQTRKLIGLEHQIHLRFYKDEWVTGHYELQPEFSPRQHLAGADLRPLFIEEIDNIREALGV